MYSKEEKMRRYDELNAEKLQKEAIAQREKAKALSYLQSEGQSVKEVSLELHEAGKLKEQRDNTLELLMREKAQTELAKLENALNIPVAAKSSTAAITVNANKPVVPAPRSSTIPAPLPAGWQVVVDKASGKNYYWNKATKVTTWTRPVAVPSAPAPPSRAVVWKEVVHPATQQVYFIHTQTGEKRWDKPDDVHENDSSSSGAVSSSATAATSVPTTSSDAAASQRAEGSAVIRKTGLNTAGSDQPSAKRSRGNGDPLEF
jgi:hypothetical protein